MKKPASKVAKPAQIQSKSQFLFHKNLPPRDFSIMTLPLELEAFSVFYWPVKSKLIQMVFERENKDFQIKSG